MSRVAKMEATSIQITTLRHARKSSNTKDFRATVIPAQTTTSGTPGWMGTTKKDITSEQRTKAATGNPARPKKLVKWVRKMRQDSRTITAKGTGVSPASFIQGSI